MPTIAEAVKRNQQRIAAQKAAPILEAAPAPALSAPAPITFPGTTELPLRSTFPPELFATDNLTSGASPQRPALRSSIWSNTEKVSNDATPTTLTNKKLIAPIIGGGTNLNRYNSIKGTVTPQAVSGNSHSTQTFTMAGVQSQDKLGGYQWNTAQTVGVTVLAVRVVGANKIAIDFYNPTGGSLTPTGGSITLFLFQ
jgi:hypothetical protein